MCPPPSLKYAHEAPLHGCDACVVLRRRCSDRITATSATVNPDVRVLRIASATPQWVILLPDGSSVSITVVSIYVNIVVKLNNIHYGAIGGLCGTFDGVWQNDLLGRWGNCTSESAFTARLLCVSFLTVSNASFPTPAAITVATFNAIKNVAGLTWAVPPSENLFSAPNSTLSYWQSPIYNQSSTFAGNLSFLTPSGCSAAGFDTQWTDGVKVGFAKNLCFCVQACV